MTRLEQKLLQFLSDYESVISNVLEIHVRDMTKIADDTQASYDWVIKNPEKVTAQDQTLVTTRGLRQAAVMFRQSAQQAQKALVALEALAEQAEEL